MLHTEIDLCREGTLFFFIVHTENLRERYTCAVKRITSLLLKSKKKRHGKNDDNPPCFADYGTNDGISLSRTREDTA